MAEITLDDDLILYLHEVARALDTCPEDVVELAVEIFIDLYENDQLELVPNTLN